MSTDPGSLSRIGSSDVGSVIATFRTESSSLKTGGGVVDTTPSPATVGLVVAVALGPATSPPPVQAAAITSAIENAPRRIRAFRVDTPARDRGTVELLQTEREEDRRPGEDDRNDDRDA